MTCLHVCYALLHACTVCVEEKTIGTKIVLDAYNWRAYIGFIETQEDKTMVKLVETQTLLGTTYRKRYYMDAKRVSEAEWRATFNNVYKTPDDVANARLEVSCMGTHKVRYTWYA